MVDRNSTGTEQPRAGSRSAGARRTKWLVPALIVFAIVMAAAVVWNATLRDGGSDDGPAETTGAADETQEVVVIDEAEVDVVQNPSLSAAVAGDGVRVENDGNVTMHDITVTDGDQEICVIETLSPGDSADCQGASSGAVVAGLGPQDQPVKITVD